ncbi:MAG TPA: hypothetical protein DEQ02_01595 [Ruminococcaceae bacterium]|nr:hypothetical protein [Oscillospiraceae bacterium]
MKAETSKRYGILFLAKAAVIAALYTVLTLGPAPISYGEMQLRISEALTVLPMFTPAAVPGLFVGCLISNGVGILMGVNALGVLDLAVGSSATLLAAICTYFLRNAKVFKLPAFAFLPPVVFNAVFVGWELHYVFGTPFFVNALWVAAGEAAAVWVLGGVLYAALRKTNILNKIA